ncbi:MAG: hypothetical protein F6K50_18925 [Moorea sp. SIO3I7]|uniref:hypothetical protein n=1 Tax=unclassified Moorena TaxID=2683338 RepID=UPI0013C9C757|nr:MULTISPECIES: hypothetical protein [unclassified Moorena]NEN97522.1 hypothetical protein [Moorena sp. SIO3I7]NEO20102.1 hypothetical protein [Moorena sp. SIO4A5]NEQ57221.1 hypothetical protein [Moorena sp. SIO4A1]
MANLIIRCGKRTFACMPLASCLVRSAIEPTFRTFKFDTTDLSLLPAPKSEEVRAKS